MPRGPPAAKRQARDKSKSKDKPADDQPKSKTPRKSKNPKNIEEEIVNTNHCQDDNEEMYQATDDNNVGEELQIPDDPLQPFHLSDNFFVRKVTKNLGVGKLGEPRLIIHHITNENFKSYAGTVILGPFHQNFTSIIGPNGSGKSNVIDSMLFVFAFSAKRIRLQNLAGLIHNSDAAKKSGNLPTSATVTIHFETIIDSLEKKGTFRNVENSRFTISRTCFKDGGSVYRIDGKKAKMKDIKIRLKNEGIDLDHNRFLILQGEVEQISLMKPKAQNQHEEGMLEYLEDIIGTERYKIPIEKLLVQTETLSDLRTDKLERVNAVEE